MKFLKYLFILIVIVIAGAAIYVALQPSHYHIHRSTEIDAPRSVVYHYIDDYSKSYNWSPWLYLEPEAEITYSEKTYGMGSYYAWKGDILGEGSIRTVYVSNDSIGRVLKFISPKASVADVYWTIKAGENTTRVTWGLMGKMSFREKIAMLIKGDMEKTVGPDYEKGLRRLDSVVTTHTKKYSITDNGPIDHDGGYYLYMTTSSKQGETTDKMAKMFPEIRTFIRKNTITMTGQPFALYHKWDEDSGTTIFSACIPVDGNVITPAGSNVLCGYIEPGRYLKTTLQGNYTYLKEAWTKAMENLTAGGHTEMPERPPFEIYVNDPRQYPDPADWKTEIYIAIQ